MIENVVSLFDGISCGQIALNKANINYKNYYASEINSDAINVTLKNYPNTIQIGDIIKLDCSILPKIDLVIGGSPCQSFSSMGKKEGFDGKSGLFYEYIRVLKELKPTYFLLENVKMKKEWEQEITNVLNEIYPDTKLYNINSKVVSAQMRNRNYWTNIPNNQPLIDKGIKFKDILDNGFVTKDKAYAILESESRPNSTNWRRFRRWRTKGIVNIVFEDESLNIFRNRILSQTELEKLQTLPVGYTNILNRNKSASVIGNGWTVDVITHIFNGLKHND
jgi:DNA-cytosine methyltransferase